MAATDKRYGVMFENTSPDPKKYFLYLDDCCDDTLQEALDHAFEARNRHPLSVFEIDTRSGTVATIYTFDSLERYLKYRELEEMSDGQRKALALADRFDAQRSIH